MCGGQTVELSHIITQTFNNFGYTEFHFLMKVLLNEKNIITRVHCTGCVLKCHFFKQIVSFVIT